jgi:hypothetical protein
MKNFRHAETISHHLDEVNDPGSNNSREERLTIKNKEGKFRVVIIGTFPSGGGGGMVVFNKTGEEVVQVFADEYGMGYVGAFDRQGKGRTLTPR